MEKENETVSEMLERKERRMKELVDFRIAQANEDIDEVFADTQNNPDIEKDIEKLKNQRKALVEQKNKTKKRKFVKRVFKVVIIGSATLALASSLIHINETKRKIDILQNETYIHGGLKDENSDKYIYNLNDHIEEGKCALGTEGSIEERITKYCIENDLPEAVKDAALEKYRLCYDKEYDEAEDIDLMEIYESVNKTMGK